MPTPELKNWKYYIADPSKKPSLLFLMLHGCGGNADDIFKFIPLLRNVIKNENFIAVAPDAFWQSCEKADGYQWFDIESNYAKKLFSSPYATLTEAEKEKFANMEKGEKGVVKASETLNCFLDFCQKKFGLKNEQTVIFGYSQGAMQALDMGISRSGKVKKVIGVAGCLIPPDKESFKKRHMVSPDVLLIHGTKDTVIDFHAAKQTEEILKQNGFNVTLCAQKGMGHGRGEESRSFWLKTAWYTAKAMASKPTLSKINTFFSQRQRR